MTREPFATVRGVPIYSDEEKPSIVWWFCKNGGVRAMTMEACDDPCEGCDCGYAAFMQQAKDGS